MVRTEPGHTRPSTPPNREQITSRDTASLTVPSPGVFEQAPPDEVLGGGRHVLEQLVGKLELGPGDVAERLRVRVAAERREARQ